MKSKLYTLVFGDILDSLGCYHQLLPREIQPMTLDMKLAGRAMPVLNCDVYGEQEMPFGYLNQALDQLKEGEIYISTGSQAFTVWGEILTATAKQRGCVGAVCFGLPRLFSEDFMKTILYETEF